MVGIAAAILVGLTVVTWRLGRNALYPPVLFNGIWALTLLCIYLAGSRFLRISEYACLIYIAGAVCFSVGSVVVLLAFPDTEWSRWPAFRPGSSTRITLDILLCALVVLFPYYLHVALKVAGTSNIIRALPVIRLRTVEEPNVNLFGIAGNLNILSILVAEALVFESDGTWLRRSRSILAVILALAYGVMTGSKFGALFLLTLFFISQVKSRQVKIANAMAVLVLALAFFGSGIVIVNLAGQNLQSAGTAVGTVGRIVSGYWLGSPIAFSRIAKKPDALVSSANIDRALLEIGSKLGLGTHVPNINNSTYVPISNDGENTNAYTIYFSYLKDFGWSGMILFAGLAAVLTLLWRRAMIGQPIAVLIYASMCTSLLQSVEAEAFFVGLEGTLKAIAVFWFLYHVLPRFLEPLWVVGRGGLTGTHVEPT